MHEAEQGGRRLSDLGGPLRAMLAISHVNLGSLTDPSTKAPNAKYNVELGAGRVTSAPLGSLRFSHEPSSALLCPLRPLCTGAIAVFSASLFPVIP